MGDYGDIAKEITQQAEDLALANFRARITTVINNTFLKGHCKFCEYPTDNGSFCDIDCRDDYTRILEKN